MKSVASKLVVVLVLILVLAAGWTYCAQYYFGIQIPKVNPVTGDTCGIVVYHNIALDFSTLDPHKIDGYLTPDEVPGWYQVSENWGGLFSKSDGTTGFGFGFLNGYCFVGTDSVTYSGDFMFSLPQEPRYRLPFVLP